LPLKASELFWPYETSERRTDDDADGPAEKLANVGADVAYAKIA